MAIALSDEQWGPIDEWILRGAIIDALSAIRVAAGVGMRGAIDAYHERYAMLRETRPGGFVCGDEEYWEEAYSWDEGAGIRVGERSPSSSGRPGTSGA